MRYGPPCELPYIGRITEPRTRVTRKPTPPAAKETQVTDGWNQMLVFKNTLTPDLNWLKDLLGDTHKPLVDALEISADASAVRELARALQPEIVRVLQGLTDETSFKRALSLSKNMRSLGEQAHYILGLQLGFDTTKAPRAL